jgi:hypothetical protein
MARDRRSRPLRSALGGKTCRRRSAAAEKRQSQGKLAQKCRIRLRGRPTRAQAEAPAARGTCRVQGAKKGAAGHGVARGSLAPCHEGCLAAEIFGAIRGSQEGGGNQGSGKAIFGSAQSSSNAQTPHEMTGGTLIPVCQLTRCAREAQRSATSRSLQ